MGEFFRCSPVRGRAQAIQESGCGQGKRADADRRDPGAALRSSPQGLQHNLGDVRCRIGQTWQDYCVGPGQRVQAPWGA